MKIRTAVAAYQEMFPEDYKDVLRVIEYQRQNLKTDLAEITETRGGGDWRAGLTFPERLSIMIGMKLNDVEREAFRETKNLQWFGKEFPQFRIAKK